MDLAALCLPAPSALLAGDSGSLPDDPTASVPIVAQHVVPPRPVQLQKHWLHLALVSQHEIRRRAMVPRFLVPQPDIRRPVIRRRLARAVGEEPLRLHQAMT